MLAVYTSPDLVAWTYRGPGSEGPPSRLTGRLPNGDAGGTVWIPNVFFDPKSNRFIMWCGIDPWLESRGLRAGGGGRGWGVGRLGSEVTRYSACRFGSGDWGTAVSNDGINFELLIPHHTSRLGGTCKE